MNTSCMELLATHFTIHPMKENSTAVVAVRQWEKCLSCLRAETIWFRQFYKQKNLNQSVADKNTGIYHIYDSALLSRDENR